MKMTLQPRSKYGRILFYPMCEISKAIASLHRDKRVANHILTGREVGLLESIGFKIELVPYLEVEK